MTFWDRLVERLRDLGEQVVEWAILIVIALIVLIIGRWILKLVRSWVEKLLGARVLDPLWERSGVAKALEGGEQTPASIGATLIYAYLMVGLFLIVARILQVRPIESLLERLLAWIPLLLVAVIVVLIAAAVANRARNLVSPFADRQGVAWLGTVVYVAVLIFVHEQSHRPVEPRVRVGSQEQGSQRRISKHEQGGREQLNAGAGREAPACPRRARSRSGVAGGAKTRA